MTPVLIIKKALMSMVRLASLGGPNKTRIMVAKRWLIANMMTEYDWVIRLQVLEGAAGVPAGTWWKKRLHGLKAASAHFEGQDVSPLWFTTGDSGMFRIVKQVVTSEINKSPYIRGGDPLDFINSALMGLTVDLTGDKTRALPAYGAGKLYKNGITSGSETPETIAKGNLGRMIKQRVMDESKTMVKVKQIPTDDEGREREIPDREYSDPVKAYKVLSDLFFDFGSSDKLANKMQDLMVDTFSKSIPMMTWLEMLKETGESPELTAVAERAGISKQSFGQRHWKPKWEMLFRRIFSDPKLMYELLDRVKAEGADIDDINVEEFLDRMESPGRLASVNQVYPMFLNRYSNFLVSIQGKRIH